MGRGRPFQVGPCRFDSKAKAQEAEKAIRARWPDRLPLTGPDEVFVRCLILERYPPEWLDNKLNGQRIKRIFVAPAPPPYQRQNRCFHIVRNDGTSTDISTGQCFDQDAPIDDFRAACRTAVRRSIEAHLNTYFAEQADSKGCVHCQLTGAIICRTEAVAHHEEPSFSEIVAGFIRERELDVRRMPSELFGYEDAESAKRFRDHRLAQDFADYHAQHVRALIVVSGRAHARLARRRAESSRAPAQ